MRRRYLTASQRAIAVAACAKWMPVSQPKNSAATALFTDGGEQEAPAEAPEPAAKSLRVLADDAGVSRQTMAQATKVVK